MSPRARKLGVALATIAAWLALGWSARARADAVSPGPLAKAHAALEARCDACHEPFSGVPAKRCLACHASLAKRIAANQGYHASVKAQACVACHPDHRGRAAALMPEPPADLNHSITGFPLEGDHAKLACERCHGKAKTRRRWAGLDTRCKACHADRAHRGGLGRECEKCHRARGWKPTRFGLADHQLPMTGGHDGLTCAGCHKAGLRLREEPQRCAQCHRRTHGGTTAACETCHRVAAWKQVSFQHAYPPERLPGKHQQAACLSCHPAYRFRGAKLVCASCHDRQRPHEPMGECEGCHSALSWKDRTFDHERTGFPLVGAHQKADCVACHPQRGTFLGASRVCEGCHQDPHGGQFDDATPGSAAPAHVGARSPAAPTAPAQLGRSAVPQAPPPLPTRPGAATPQRPARGLAPAAGPSASPQPRPSAPGTCARCHTPNGWSPSTITASQHASFGFELRGAHTRAACKSCHTKGAYVGLASTCVDCHADPRHRGRFGADCASCHGEVAWSPAAAFDHDRTGFALRGAHARPTCKACHGGDGLRLASSTEPKACATCHAPVRHGRLFGKRCADCHNTVTFRDVPPFDHAARTDFPLELRHATLKCLTCHDPRKRPVLNSACRTCHGDPHRVSNGMECQDCHRSDRWRIIRFDHDLTSYPLTGRHRVVGCGGCHANPNWTGVRTDCVTCHAFDRPKTLDHPPELTCEDCHVTARWDLILE